MDRIENLNMLSQYCAEFLVHGVDVEGKKAGIDVELVQLLGVFTAQSHIPVTYAGGVRSLQDLDLINDIGQGRVDCTIGSALDCFGGDLAWDEVLAWNQRQLEISPLTNTTHPLSSPNEQINTEP
jgi:phosphoribosylformimino-5-aminoimidazole carboxamide ribotide isomerase